MSLDDVFDTLSILGGIGFVVAGILAFLQLRDYYRPLRLLITYLDCQPTSNKTSLVLFRLSFVNPSSRGRTVYGLDVTSKVAGIPLIELKEEVDSNLHSVTYSLPSLDRQLPFDEILQLPLDIPPNQSLNKWKAIAVSYHDVESPFGTPILFEATEPKGIHRRQLGENKWEYQGVKKTQAKAEVVLFPAKRQARAVDIYREARLST